MLDKIAREFEEQWRSIREAVVTREFWIYVGAILAIMLVGIGGAYYAIGFDNLSREKLMIVLACQAGEKQLGVIIIGAFTFCIVAFFALGEVAAWVEEWRRSKTARWKMSTSVWRPIIAVGSAMAVGLAGVVVMSFWCI
jgi:hypothetical protein